MLINLRNALMTGKRLPYDAEVEYLESTGTQWIDTGVDAALCNSAIMKTECAFSVTGSGGPGGNYNGVFGAAVPRFGVYTISNNLSWGYGQSHDNVKTFTYGDWIESTCVFTKGNQTATFDGSSFTATSVLTLNSRTIGVFCRNATPVQWLALAKIRYLRIYVDSVLVRDYIPVRVGAVGYLYDRVSGKLFGNAGTGDFVLGPDVVPVEYLQSTGTQWIDTATPTADKYTFECLFTNATTDIKLFGNSYAYGRYRDLSIYQSRYRGTSIATSSNEWDRIEIDVAQPRLTVTRSGSTVGSATSWWSAYTGATPDTQYGTALPFGGHINASGRWYGTNRVTCFLVAQGVRLRMRLFESWLGSELIEKLIPVRIGTEGAMMDVLTRRIYRNAGTGAFGYGNDLKYPIPAE